MSEHGVGLVYWRALETACVVCDNLIDVLEVEPQAYWVENDKSDERFRLDTVALNAIAARRQKKLVHGVGFPVGGTKVPDPRHIPPLRQTIEILEAQWASEHLSFNEAEEGGERFQTGFLLPSLQTSSGVQAAVQTIRSVKSQISVPFLIETGVNYLRPRPGEIPDGAFIAAIAEHADCGILLDLHNIWTNQRNGRQPVKDFLRQIPLDRVLEIHLAGGIYVDRYWVDGHSGPIPEALFELAKTIMPSLPNLGALIFELLPDYIEQLQITGIRKQLENLHSLWDRRGKTRNSRRDRNQSTALSVYERIPQPTPAEWEQALGALVGA